VILSRLDHADRYAACHRLFPIAFNYLRGENLAELPEGRHVIDDDRLFAIVSRDLGRGKSDAVLEHHARYIDIQYVISGFDLIGWSEVADCRKPKRPFDRERDLGFFNDVPSSWLRVSDGSLAIFYPEDAHAPLGTSGPVHKIVLKVIAESSFA